MQNVDLKNENGRSMIEMLGVLAIIGVLSVGGIAGYSKAMHKYRVNKTIEQITLIAGNVRTFFANQKSYAGADCLSSACDATKGCRGFDGFNNDGSVKFNANGCPIIKKAKIFPDEMITTSGDKIMSFTSPFGEYVNLISDNDSFRIEYYVSADVCIELLSHDWNIDKLSYITLVGGGPTTTLTLPIDINIAINKCFSSGWVKFYFK